MAKKIEEEQEVEILQKAKAILARNEAITKTKMAQILKISPVILTRVLNKNEIFLKSNSELRAIKAHIGSMNAKKTAEELRNNKELVLKLLPETLKPLEEFTVSNLFAKMAETYPEFSSVSSHILLQAILKQKEKGFFGSYVSGQSTIYTYQVDLVTKKPFENPEKAKDSTGFVVNDTGFCNYFKKNEKCLGESELMLVREAIVIDYLNQSYVSSMRRMVCKNCYVEFFKGAK